MHSSVDSVEADYIPPASSGETSRPRQRFRVAAVAAAGLILAISFVGYVSGTKIESMIWFGTRISTK